MLVGLGRVRRAGTRMPWWMEFLLPSTFPFGSLVCNQFMPGREPSGRSRHCSHGVTSLFFSYLPSHAQLALSPKLEYSLHSCLVKLVEYILTLLIIYTSERLTGVCLLSPLDKNEEINRREIKPLDWIFKDFIIARGSMLGTGGLRRHSISSGMSFHVTLAHTYFFFIAWLMLIPQGLL